MSRSARIRNAISGASASLGTSASPQAQATGRPPLPPSGLNSYDPFTEDRQTHEERDGGSMGGTRLQGLQQSPKKVQAGVLS